MQRKLIPWRSRSSARADPEASGQAREPAGTSFESLLRPHVDTLYRIAYRFTGAREDAEDLVQDLLVKLYPRRAELKDIARLRPWLVRVMYRQFIDDTRKRARVRMTPLRAVEPDSGAVDSLDTLVSDEPGPEDAAARAIGAARLGQALRLLGADHRAVIALHDMEGHTLEELSASLEVPVGTLKSRLHRARRRLREILEGH